MAIVRLQVSVAKGSKGHGTKRMATLIYRIASKTFGIRLTCNNENGFILGITILFMAVLTILESSAVVITMISRMVNLPMSINAP